MCFIKRPNSFYIMTFPVLTHFISTRSNELD